MAISISVIWIARVIIFLRAYKNKFTAGHVDFMWKTRVASLAFFLVIFTIKLSDGSEINANNAVFNLICFFADSHFISVLYSWYQ